MIAKIKSAAYTSESVYNASDLANANLITYSKKEKDRPEETVIPQEIKEEVLASENITGQIIENEKITLFPNPVTSGTAHVVFNGYKNGRYELQLLSLNGKLIQKKNVFVNAKAQQAEINNLQRLAKRSYLINVINEKGLLLHTEKIIVQ